MRLLRVLFVASSLVGAGWWSLTMVSMLSATQSSVLSPQSSRASARHWPQFRGDLQLTGVSDSTVPRELKLLWTYDAGESIDSSAAIADGTVYVGTYAGELLAIDLETGTPRWTYQTGDFGIGESSPAVADGTVYIGDLSGVLHAVSVQDGTARWTFQTDGEIRSSPVLVGDHVLIGSYDGYLYGLSARTGELAWQLETNNYVHATPSVADGVAYFGGCDEMFRGGSDHRR